MKVTVRDHDLLPATFLGDSSAVADIHYYLWLSEAKNRLCTDPRPGYTSAPSFSLSPHLAAPHPWAACVGRGGPQQAARAKYPASDCLQLLSVLNGLLTIGIAAHHIRPFLLGIQGLGSLGASGFIVLP